MTRYFAVTDDNRVVAIEAATIEDAFNKEPPNTHWMYSEEGLRELIANAIDAMKGE